MNIIYKMQVLDTSEFIIMCSSHPYVSVTLVLYTVYANPTTALKKDTNLKNVRWVCKKNTTKNNNNYKILRRTFKEILENKRGVEIRPHFKDNNATCLEIILIAEIILGNM